MQEGFERGGMQPQEMKHESREVKPESKVGLSLSLCVRDILQGKVKETEVKEIITNTKITSPEEMKKVFDLYKNSYWEENPEECEAIAWRLFTAGKIRQPRIEGGKEHHIASGRWLDAEKAEEQYKKRLEETIDL